MSGMRRREFITFIGGAAASWPLAARGQQGERMRRIGVLIAGLTENDSEGKLRMAAFREGLQNLGWIEGRNVQHRGALARRECRAPAKLRCRAGRNATGCYFRRQ